AVWPSVASVGRQIDENLVHLNRVDIHAPQALLQVRLQGDVFPEQPFEYAAHAQDDPVKVHSPRPDHLAFAEGQQLLGQPGRALGRVTDFTDHVGVDRMAGGPGLQDFSRAADDGEQVVEVVGNASRQTSDCFHFLHRVQTFLQDLAFGHVAAKVGHAGETAIFIIDTEHARLHPDRFSGHEVPHDKFALPYLSGENCGQDFIPQNV